MLHFPFLRLYGFPTSFLFELHSATRNPSSTRWHQYHRQSSCSPMTLRRRRPPTRRYTKTNASSKNTSHAHSNRQTKRDTDVTCRAGYEPIKSYAAKSSLGLVWAASFSWRYLASASVCWQHREWCSVILARCFGSRYRYSVISWRSVKFATVTQLSQGRGYNNHLWKQIRPPVPPKTLDRLLLVV